MNHALRLASGASFRLPLGLLIVALLSTAALLLSNSSLSIRWEPAPLSWSGLADSHAPASNSDALTWRISSGEHQQFQASFTPSGVLAFPESGAGPAWDWRMALTAYGYDGDIQSARPTAASVNGQSAEYQRGALTEWYKNTPLGLEQGFTLSGPPATSAAGVSPLRLDLTTSGSLIGSLSQRGDSVIFSSPAGAALLRYDNLHAFDANGMELPSWMTYEAGRLSIFVDDSQAVYPITIDPIIATETRLNPSDLTAGKQLGASVATDGALLIAGAWGDSQQGASAGAAYIFEDTGAGWVQRAKLVASDGATDDYFGYAVDISGTVAVVGAKGRGDNGFWSGAAYVFRWNGASSAWEQEVKLLPSDIQMGDQFGNSVAINADMIVVGAVGQNSATGAAYVFRYDGTAWTQEAKLVAPSGAAGDSFGVAVAANGNSAIVGAQGRGSLTGAAYVFGRTGGAWSQEAVLTASDGATSDMFGAAVAASGNTAVIGAPFADAAGQDSGAAYVFSDKGGSWTQDAKLVPVDAAASDIFGFAVAVEGDTAAIGSVNDDDKGLNSGSVYLFQRSSGVWVEQGKLTASDGTTSDEFGHAVAIQSSALVVGAYLAHTGALADTGAVYVYVFSIVANQPPTASAGGPYTVRAGVSVSLVGTASDPNGDPLAFDWDLDNDNVFETPGKNVTFSTTGKTPGDYTVSFRACDPSNACAVSVTTVSVVANNPPTANAGGPYTVPEAASVTLTGSGSDPDGDAVTFIWDLNYNTIYETDGQAAAFPPVDVSGVGPHGVRLKVCDIYNACAVSETIVTITNVTPTANAGGPYSVRVSNSVTLTGSASDPGGGPLTYTWDLDNDGSFETPGQSAVFTATGPLATPGAHTVTFRACDSSNGCGTSSATVNVIANRPPTANAGGPYSVIENATVTLTGSGSDPDGDPLTYAWDLDNDGSFETAGQTALFPSIGVSGLGPHTVNLQVCDSYGACVVAQTTVTIKEKPLLAALAYALLGTAKRSVRVGVQATVSGGLVGGNGDVWTLNNSRVGDVVAGDDVSIGIKAKAGNITAGGKVKLHKDAVTGTIVENASVPVVTLPAVNANPDKKKDIKRSQRDVKAGPLDLAPGRYGDLNSAVQDRIILHGGEYHFSSVSIDAKSKITVDLRNGLPLVVRVAGNLKFGVKVQMEVVGGSAADIVFLMGGKEMRLMEGGTYLGTFVAPSGNITLGVNATLNGSAWGRRAQTLHRSVMTWVAFAHAEVLGPAQALQTHVGDVDEAEWEDD